MASDQAGGTRVALTQREWAAIDAVRGTGELDGDGRRLLVEELRDEIVRTLLGVHGDRYHDRPAMSGMAGHYACLLGPWAPHTVELVESRRLVGLAERLVGGKVLPSPCDTQGIL